MEYNLLPGLHPSIFLHWHPSYRTSYQCIRSPMHVHSLGGLYTSLCIIMLNRVTAVFQDTNLFSSEAVWLFVLYRRISANKICVRKYSCPQIFYDPCTLCTFPHRMNLMWHKTASMKTQRWTVCKYEYISHWIWLAANESRKMVSHSLFITGSHPGFFLSQWHHQVEVWLSRFVRECFQMCCTCNFCFIHQWKNRKTPQWGRVFSRGNENLLCALLWLLVM